jgi:hypothetical protein
MKMLQVLSKERASEADVVVVVVVVVVVGGGTEAKERSEEAEAELVK